MSLGHPLRTMTLDVEFDAREEFDTLAGLTLWAAAGGRRVRCVASRRKLDELAEPYFRNARPCLLRALRPELEREFARRIAANPTAESVRL